MNCDVAPHDDEPDVCGICAVPLRGAQSRWCSKAHARLYYQNHYWTQARSAAKRRDRYACVMVSFTFEKELPVRFGPSERCTGRPLEVNHKIPRNGAGYDGPNCAHHLDKLETLCHAHHVIETNRQAKERRESATASA